MLVWIINIHTIRDREFRVIVEAETDVDALSKALIVYRNDEDKLDGDAIHMVHVSAPH